MIIYERTFFEWSSHLYFPFHTPDTSGLRGAYRAIALPATRIFPQYREARHRGQYCSCDRRICSSVTDSRSFPNSRWLADGCLGSASRLTRCQDTYDPLFYFLLGNCFSYLLLLRTAYLTEDYWYLDRTSGRTGFLSTITNHSFSNTIKQTDKE